MDQGKRRGALVRPHRQLPRQRGGRVLPRDPQGRDVPPPLVCHARGGEVRRDRLHRVLLQPQAPPLDNRLQGAGRRDGRVLRALRERVVGAEGGVASGINPGFFVSEILTQVTSTIFLVMESCVCTLSQGQPSLWRRRQMVRTRRSNSGWVPGAWGR